jgi:uncharacterized protein
MKLQPDRSQGPTITGYGDGWVAVNGEQTNSSLLISSMGHRQDWQARTFEALDAACFDPMLDWGAELVLFGSGPRLRFANPKWLAALYARRIGVETMDTQAACRTYNFLAGEGRRVVAALLV